jgi:hypothetical protein
MHTTSTNVGVYMDGLGSVCLLFDLKAQRTYELNRATQLSLVRRNVL